MKAFRKADRQVLGWALAVWALVTVLGAFWAFPHIEDELDTRALRVDSYTSVDGAEVTWHGRDGFLTVPDGTPGVEQIAADLADTWGVRDVEIVSGNTPPASDPETETTPDLIPAVFDVTWDDDGIVGNGNVPDGTEGEFNSLFGTGAGLADDDTRTISDPTRATLTNDLAPLIRTELPQGRITVDGDLITITGIADDQATADSLADRLAGIDDLTVDVTGPATSPAKFNVAWDGTGSTQTGNAPSGLDGNLSALGIGSPLTGDNLTVGPDVEPSMGALAPLIGSDLSEGTLAVDGDLVTITGTAVNAEALARAQAALEGTNATLDLSVSNVGQAQAEIDALLALESVEFVYNTAIPTQATEGIIDSVADVLSRFESIDVTVTGHTDSHGPDDYNQTLSDSRAQAVKQGLIDRDINESRLSASGKGETEPIDTNDTDEGRQRNRRVEITAKESN